MGTRERREREKGRRREEIIEAARRLFWKKGFAATTMPEIAAAAELAPGTLYLYFASKDALYVELLLECYDDLIERLRAAARKPGAPRRRAEGLIDAFLSFARKQPQCFDIIFFVLQREIGGPRHAWLDKGQLERLTAKENACLSAAAEVLAPGEEEPLRAHRVTVEAVWSMLTGVVYFWRNDPEKQFSAVSGEAKRVILEALF